MSRHDDCNLDALFNMTPEERAESDRLYALEQKRQAWLKFACTASTPVLKRLIDCEGTDSHVRIVACRTLYARSVK